jgi:hypothetical protein
MVSAPIVPETVAVEAKKKPAAKRARKAKQQTT